MHALGGNVWMAQLDGPASGVMMIPIPGKGGIYHGVEGVERALAVADIEDVTITATEGQMLVPLPEGSSYLGFIFARGESAGGGGTGFAAVARGTAIPHCDRARDV